MATRRQTVSKIAISVPRDVLKEVDRTARHQGITRSRFITRAIMRSLRKYEDEVIQRQINRVLADPRARIDEHEWDEIYEKWIKEHP